MPDTALARGIGSPREPRRLKWRRVLVGLTLAALVAPVGARADVASAHKAAAQLEKLRSEIAELNAAEQAEIARKHRVLGELSQLERQINRLTKHLAKLGRRMRKLSDQQATLEGEATKAESRADVAKQDLATFLRAAFVLGRQPEIKLVLGGNAPSAVARLLTYYGYFARASAVHLANLVMLITKYERLQLNLVATKHKLDATTSTEKNTLSSLKRTRAEREVVVAELTRDIGNKNARAAMLRRDAARLEQIVQSVNQDLADIPSAALAQVNFEGLRGQLPWPVTGGTNERTDARANGTGRADVAVTIRAPAGTPVRAIAYGRIAYAGWLPYYGLVLIVDHGGGYLTIYGHNEVLYKQVGDWVSAGDVVSAVGTSGGLRKPELYFQIRHNDRSLDPNHWCVRHKASAR